MEKYIIALVILIVVLCCKCEQRGGKASDRLFLYHPQIGVYIYSFNYGTVEIVYLVGDEKTVFSAKNGDKLRYNNDNTFTVLSKDGRETYTSDKFSLFDHEGKTTFRKMELRDSLESVQMLIDAIVNFPVLREKEPMQEPKPTEPTRKFELHTVGKDSKVMYEFRYGPDVIYDKVNKKQLPSGQVKYNGNYTFTIHDRNNEVVFTSEKFSFFNTEGVNESNVFVRPVRRNSKSVLIDILNMFPNFKLSKVQLQTVLG